MSYYEKISCRIAVQVCIGYFPDGRERHRTFSMRGINPDAAFEAIADVIRALAPLLAHPITKVRKVIKREIIFYEEAAMPVPQDADAVEAAPAPTQTNTPRIIPFPVEKRYAAREAAADVQRRLNCVILPFALPAAAASSQVGFLQERAPPEEETQVACSGFY